MRSGQGTGRWAPFQLKFPKSRPGKIKALIFRDSPELPRGGARPCQTRSAARQRRVRSARRRPGASPVKTELSLLRTRRGGVGAWDTWGRVRCEDRETLLQLRDTRGRRGKGVNLFKTLKQVTQH
ncbi:uncharacterized protein LOC144334919 isoform X2 [Macaca mulatta]